MEEEGLHETLFEKAEARNYARPTPAFVADLKNIDLKYVAGLCVVDGDGTGEGVDAAAIDGEKFFGGHAGVDLCATGVLAFEADSVAGVDVET